MRALLFVLVLAATSFVTAGYVPQPVIHFTPPPWAEHHTGGDIAGAMLHPVTKVWHVMPLAWGVGWAHCSTEDLVSWRYHGTAARLESGSVCDS